jgi:hypothetical protein
MKLYNEKRGKKTKCSSQRNKQGKGNVLQRYNELETKHNPKNAFLKTAVDALAAVMVGPALSATFGKYAPLVGAALTFGGHYTGDSSGLLRGIGMSTLAHSVAKVKDYRSPNSTAMDRLSELTDDWLRFSLLKNDSVVNGLQEEYMATTEDFRRAMKEHSPTEVPANQQPEIVKNSFNWQEWFNMNQNLNLL